MFDSLFANVPHSKIINGIKFDLFLNCTGICPTNLDKWDDEELSRFLHRWPSSSDIIAEIHKRGVLRGKKKF